MSSGGECGGRRQQKQPTPQTTEISGDGGVVRRETNGEKNLIRPNYQFLVLYPIQRRSEKERSLQSLISECIFWLGTLVCKMSSWSTLVIYCTGKGGRDDQSKEGGGLAGGRGSENRGRGGSMDQFTGLGLSSNVLLLQKFSEYLRRVWGSREAGGGGRRGAMGIGNTEGTIGGGDGGQGGGGGGGGSGGDGGQGGGGNGDGGDGGQGGGGSGGGDAAEREGDRNLTPTVNFSKLSKISIAVSAQTSGAIISFYFTSPSSLSKILLVSTLVTNLLSYLFCLSSILLNHKRPWIAGILGAIGIATSALGFIQMIAMSLPATLVWIVVLACLVFLLVFVMAYGLSRKD